MTPIWLVSSTSEQPIIDSDGKLILCDNCPCCVATDITEWDVVDVSGFLDSGDPYTITPDQLGIRVDFEDAENEECGGSNPNNQRVELSTTFTVCEDSILQVTIDGRGETQESGFERILVGLNGVSVRIAESPGNDFAGDCGMDDIVPTGDNPRVFNLNTGQENTLTFTFETGDGQWHQGAFLEVALEILPAPSP